MPSSAVGGAARPPRPTQRSLAPSGRKEPYEPTIGIDIGVPIPARRIQPDPAAQTRTMVVAVVAIVAIALVLVIALAISRLGGDSTPEGLALPGSTTAANALDPDATATTGDGMAPSGLTTTPGIVPDLEGQPQEVAIAAIREAGFEPNVTTSPDDAPAGMVLDQAPGAGVEHTPGGNVTIVVSEGPQ
jgi:hypothetical protein